MRATRRDVLVMAGKAAAVVAAGALVGCEDTTGPGYLDVIDPDVRARGHRIRLLYAATGEGSTTILMLGASRGQPVEVDVVTTTGRSLISLERSSDRAGAQRVRLEPGRPAAVWVTANGVGEPERAGDRLLVRGPGWTMPVEVWIEPTGGRWRGGGPAGAPLNLGMVAVHTSLMRTGPSSHLMSFSPPRQRDRATQQFVRDPHRPGQFLWNLGGLEDVEIGTCELSDFTVRSQRMEDTPNTRRWNLFCAGHAHLPDGRLLVAGGHSAFGGDNARHLHVYDPNDRSWRRVGTDQEEVRMRAARWYPTVTTLPDGRMLITTGSPVALAEGWDSFYWDNILNDYEIFDPVSMRLLRKERDSLIDESVLPRTDDGHADKLATYPAVFVVPRGRGVSEDVVLIIETNRAWLSKYQPDAERPLQREGTRYTMRSRGSRSYPHFGSFVMLPVEAGDTRFSVLAVGGQSETNGRRRDFDPTSLATATAEVFEYDSTRPLSDQPGWRRVGDMSQRRVLCDATLLADGKVLVSGGATSGWANRNGGDARQADIFDPVSENFTPADSARADRRYHATAVLLPDGTVLKAGSHGGFAERPTSINAHLDAERFLPPYLWRGPRPRLRTVGGGFQIRYGATFDVVADGDSLDRHARVAVVRCGSVTHGFDMDQRYVRLQATSVPDGAGRRFTVTAPPDPATAPPGDYMLLVVDGIGVPSEAAFVRFAR